MYGSFASSTQKLLLLSKLSEVKKDLLALTNICLLFYLVGKRGILYAFRWFVLLQPNFKAIP